jgi:hypothetical protein
MLIPTVQFIRQSAIDTHWSVMSKITVTDTVSIQTRIKYVNNKPFAIYAKNSNIGRAMLFVYLWFV